MKYAHVMTVNSRLTECVQTETYCRNYRGFFLIETSQAVHHLFCFKNVAYLLLFTQQERDKFGGVVIYRLSCNGFTSQAHLRSNWAVCVP